MWFYGQVLSVWWLNFLRMLVKDFGGCAFKTRFRCSGSQIEISIMKSVSEDQCEWLLIYNHDDLSDLHIEINFSKKIIFLVDLSSKLASKKRLEEILKERGKENEFGKKFSSNSIFWSGWVLIWWSVLKSISWVHSKRFQWWFDHVSWFELNFQQNLSLLQI